MSSINEIEREPASQSALATCGSILFNGSAGETEIEAILRRRNLIYSIDCHLHANGNALDAVTRALLAASRELVANSAKVEAASCVQTD